MSKIYEALERAQRERRGVDKNAQVLVAEECMPEGPVVSMEHEMLGLYTTIDSMLPHLPRRVIQFIGFQEGEGTSSVVREFARIAAFEIGKSVLLLDADRHQPSQHHFFAIRNEYGWIEAIKDGERLEDALRQVGESRLFVSPSTNSSVFTPEIFDSPRIESFWERLRERFELVLIDSPPLSVSPDGLAIASRVDGVILVLEAEKTRWQTAKNVAQRIAQVGGNIIGVVLNKRRYYIPSFIYKWL
jgi:capsular exopolysaccharide synthesis family protein